MRRVLAIAAIVMTTLAFPSAVDAKQAWAMPPPPLPPAIACVVLPTGGIVCGDPETAFFSSSGRVVSLEEHTSTPRHRPAHRWGQR